jgi:hypothetical protein
VREFDVPRHVVDEFAITISGKLDAAIFAAFFPTVWNDGLAVDFDVIINEHFARSLLLFRPTAGSDAKIELASPVSLAFHFLMTI